MRRILLNTALLAAAGGGGANSPIAASPAPPTPSPSPAASTGPVTATVLMYDNMGDRLTYGGHAFKVTGATCRGTGLYAEFSASHSADLKGPDNSIVASANLGEGTVVAAAAAKPMGCRLDVAYAGVPLGLDLAKIIVAGHDGPTFHNADLFGTPGLVFNEAQ